MFKLFEAKKEEKQPETKEEKKGDTKAFGKEQKNGVTVTVTYNKPVWTEADIDGKRVETATGQCWVDKNVQWKIHC